MKCYNYGTEIFGNSGKAMTYPPKLRKRALELINEGNSAEKVVELLSLEPEYKGETPTARTIRNWKKSSYISRETEINNELLKEAQEEHLDLVGKLIEEFRNALFEPINIFNVYYRLCRPSYRKAKLFKHPLLESPLSLERFELNPLFKCLHEHIPYPSLWQDYSNWKAKFENYINICKSIIETIENNGKTWPAQLDEDFIVPLLNDIVGKNLWPEQQINCKLVPRENKLLAYYDYIEGEEFDDSGDYEPPYITLMASHPEEYIGKYIDLRQAIWDSEIVDASTKLFDEMEHLQDKLYNNLQGVALSKDYIRHKCSLCPEAKRFRYDSGWKLPYRL